jgi:hypothetical protein
MITLEFHESSELSLSAVFKGFCLKKFNNTLTLFTGVDKVAWVAGDGALEDWITGAAGVRVPGDRSAGDGVAGDWATGAARDGDRVAGVRVPGDGVPGDGVAGDWVTGAAGGGDGAAGDEDGAVGDEDGAAGVEVAGAAGAGVTGDENQESLQKLCDLAYYWFYSIITS